MVPSRAIFFWQHPPIPSFFSLLPPWYNTTLNRQLLATIPTNNFSDCLPLDADCSRNYITFAPPSFAMPTKPFACNQHQEQCRQQFTRGNKP
jgi:hypothetical protein